MKKCYTCQTEKEKSEFNKNKGRKDGLNSICRTCSNARSRQYYAENREKHLKVIGLRRDAERLKTRQYLYAYLKKHSCVDCGESRPATLDFDHVRGQKSFGISSAVGSHSLNKIIKEMQKCEVRCANCHRIKTASERGWYKDLDP